MDTQVNAYSDQGSEGSGKAIWLLTGLATGAAFMYFWDDRGGARRRAFVRDKVFHWQRSGLMFLDKRTRDIGNRIYGAFTEIMNSYKHRGEVVDDAILMARIRSKMGRAVSHPKMVDLMCADGRVIIGGYALQKEIPRLFSIVRSVRGVRSVVNRIQPIVSEKQMSYAAGAISNQSSI